MSGRGIQLVPGTEPYPGYQLLQRIGQGGWSEVWKAREPDGGECALKFMPCDPGMAPSREVRALQALRPIKHEHILENRHIWCCAGYVVIVMDLCDGSLLDLLDVYLREVDDAIQAEQVCHFLGQAAAAIDFLNTRRHLINDQRMAIRHCDVKPSNMLIHGQKLKLADFSVAVPTTENMQRHRADGTPAYLAPEVFQGWLSDRTDQYALAVSYYQLRTGGFPFPALPRGKVPKGYVRPAPDLSGVTPREGEVLARALAPVPHDRWRSCAYMMQLLEAYCAVSSSA